MDENEKRDLTLKVLEIFNGKKYSDAYRVLMDCIHTHLGENSEVISEFLLT